MLSHTKNALSQKLLVYSHRFEIKDLSSTQLSKCCQWCFRIEFDKITQAIHTFLVTLSTGIIKKISVARARNNKETYK